MTVLFQNALGRKHKLRAQLALLSTLMRAGNAAHGFVHMIAPDESDKDRMKYAILGGSELSEADKLAQAMGEVGWSYLAPHYRNGTLYFVDPEFSLESVGLAFTNNCRDQVEAWLKSGDLVKIGQLHAAQWENKEGDDAVRFEALVVSPFVLCRPV